MMPPSRIPNRSLRPQVKGIEESSVPPGVVALLATMSIKERMKLLEANRLAMRTLVEISVREQRPELVGRPYEDEVIRRLTGGDRAVQHARLHGA
jgi:hypothetical protein